MRELVQQAQPVIIALIASGGLWATIRAYITHRGEHESKIDETVELLLAFQRDEIKRMAKQVADTETQMRELHRESVVELATLRAELVAVKDQLKDEVNRADKNYKRAQEVKRENKLLKARVVELEREVAELKTQASA